MKQDFSKRLQKTYIIALAIIALLTIGSQYLVRRAIDSQASDSRVINIAGRQRMLSQKLAKTALILATDTTQNATRIQEFQETLGLWSRAHKGLQFGDKQMQLPSLNNDSVKTAFAKIEADYQQIADASIRLIDIYTQNNEGVNQAFVQGYLQTILAHEGSFLKQMNEIVNLYEREAQRKIENLKKIELFLLIITLITLFLEAYFIFRPAIKNIKLYIEKIQNYNEELATSEEEIRQNLEEIHAMHDSLLISQNKLKQLSLIAQNTSDCMIITDSEGFALWVNDGFYKLTGYTIEDIRDRKPGRILQGKATDPETVKRIREKLSNREVVMEDIINYDKSGRKYWTRILINPVFENGELTNFIAVQNDITERKNSQDAIEQQKKQIEALYKDVTTSINFAQKIQTAILPQKREIDEYLPQNFIIYKPKNIVSGDFYWFYATGHQFIIVAADCTGHGVPGAFMSLIGNDLLNQIVVGRQILQPSLILKELNEEIRVAFRQDKILNHVGMDLAICMIENYGQGKTNKKLWYAGAKSPLIYVRNNQIHKIDPSGVVLGVTNQKEFIFEQHQITIDSPTSFYLFSDGYHDQFGGSNNEKMKKKHFQELLFQVNQLPMEEQGKLLAEWFEDWKGNKKQTDDVMVIGFKIES